MPINTKQVKRRDVRYESLDDAVADMRQLAQCERDGKLDQLGNWSLGQAIGHVATWAEYAFSPCPVKPPPWFIRWVMPLFKNRFLNKGMPSGMSIPGVEGGTVGTEPMPTSAALDKVQAATDRLKRDAPTQPSPAFGKLTQEEATKLNLRHMELHMGFFRERE